MEVPIILLIGITSALGLASLARACFALGQPTTYRIRGPYADSHDYL
jgi:hypothetical protein